MGFSIGTLLVAMASIQIGASVAKNLFPVVGAVGATFLRLLFATLILFVIWKPWRGKLNTREMTAIALYGAALGFMNLLFYMALERIPLGIAVALEFTGPLTIALASSRKALDFIWAALAIVGIIMIMPLTHASRELDPVGMLFALGAGGCWALYILFGQRAGSSVHGGRATALGMLVAFLVVLPVGIGHAKGIVISYDILPIALVVSVLSSALPYSLEMFALKKLPTQTFGILMSLEPALAALSGLLFLGEYLSFIQWLAIACIMVASVGSSFSAKQDHEATPVDVMG
jgi:inner membrane transporter RhtA